MCSACFPPVSLLVGASLSSKRSTKASARFLPVQVEPLLSESSAVEIVLDRPPRVRVGRGFDAELLREVLCTVEQL